MVASLGGAPTSPPHRGRAMSDAAAATECKRIEGQVKAIRARIRRLPKTAPGPGRQRDRLGNADNLILVASRLQEAACGILLEPEGQ